MTNLNKLGLISLIVNILGLFTVVGIPLAIIFNIIVYSRLDALKVTKNTVLFYVCSVVSILIWVVVFLFIVFLIYSKSLSSEDSIAITLFVVLLLLFVNAYVLYKLAKQMDEAYLYSNQQLFQISSIFLKISMWTLPLIPISFVMYIFAHILLNVAVFVYKAPHEINPHF